jgi:hypothetical protein
MSDFTLQNLDNQYIHLCNNSIQKDGCDAEKILKESMWDLPTFRQHLIGDLLKARAHFLAYPCAHKQANK